MPAPVAAGTLPQKRNVETPYLNDLLPGFPTIEIGTAELPTDD